ncbi:MAG: GTP-binding protein, partial [Firmicutes bacterium]|nr:GTP-binding protein [Bacillota bacterium]
MTRFKNIGILAHVDAGKTTLTEQLLAVSGAISAPGTVDKGTATTDSLDVERRRGISVKTASVALPLGEDVINIVDTPGHTDFIGEVERSLAVLDGVVLVISAAEGVQAQTTLLLDAVRRLHLPALLVMNKLDRAGCDPPAVIEDVKRELSSDLVVMCDCLGAGESGVEIVQRSLDLEDFREDLLLTLANTDPALEERYFAGEEIAVEELLQLFRQAIAKGRVYPLFFTCAKLGKGVAPLLSALGELLPWASGHDDDPLSGVIYRVQYDPSLGKLAHVRLFGGCLKNRDPLPLLGEEGEPEKIAQIKRYTAGKLQDSGRLCAGDIGVLTGISKARIGQIIGNEDVSRDCRLAVPLLMIKVTPDDPQQLPRMMQALSQLSEE